LGGLHGGVVHDYLAERDAASVSYWIPMSWGTVCRHLQGSLRPRSLRTSGSHYPPDWTTEQTFK